MVRGAATIAGPTLAAVFGLLLARLAMTGEHTHYVKASMGPWILLTGAFFLFLGLWSLPRQINGDHHHHHLPRAAWFLAIPVLVVALLNPMPLGAFSARSAVAGPAPGVQVAPLPPGEDVVTMRADHYVIRSIYSDPTPLRERRFRIIGFVTHPNGPEADWDLTRLAVMCCASDAGAYRITARGAEQLPDDTWVEVVGAYAPPGELSAALRVESVRRIPAPAEPYL
ncbi:TIGR03943 family putative permease subunit [Mariniluteicoccus flavus]